MYFLFFSLVFHRCRRSARDREALYLLDEGWEIEKGRALEESL
jgi:hypothetical protein